MERRPVNASIAGTVSNRFRQTFGCQAFIMRDPTVAAYDIKNM
jgi:hypothetical protein